MYCKQSWSVCESRSRLSSGSSIGAMRCRSTNAVSAGEGRTNALGCVQSQSAHDSPRERISSQAPGCKRAGSGGADATSTVARVVISKAWCAWWRSRRCRVLPKQSVSRFRLAGGCVSISKSRSRCPRSSRGSRHRSITLLLGWGCVAVAREVFDLVTDGSSHGVSGLESLRRHNRCTPWSRARGASDNLLPPARGVLPDLPGPATRSGSACTVGRRAARPRLQRAS